MGWLRTDFKGSYFLQVEGRKMKIEMLERGKQNISQDDLLTVLMNMDQVCKMGERGKGESTTSSTFFFHLLN